ERLSPSGLSGGSGQAGGLLQQEGYRERTLAHGGLGALARPFRALSAEVWSVVLRGMQCRRPREGHPATAKARLRASVTRYASRGPVAGTYIRETAVRGTMGPRFRGDDTEKRNTMLLSDVLVIDATDRLGWLAGRVLADLGADVIKLESPGIDHSRADWRAFNVN